MTNTAHNGLITSGAALLDSPLRVETSGLFEGYTMAEVAKMMANFEAWVINNDVRGLHIYDDDKDEDEFGSPYYMDIHTQRTFFAFAGGYAMAATHHEQAGV